MSFNILKKQIEEDFITSERKLEQSQQVIEKRTGAKVLLSTVLCLSLLATTIGVEISKEQNNRDKSISFNSTSIYSTAKSMDDRDDGILNLSSDVLYNVPFDQTADTSIIDFIDNVKNQKKIICSGEDLSKMLTASNEELIFYGGEIYSKTGIQTVFSFKEKNYICQTTINAIEKIVKDPTTGVERVIYTAPTGYILKGNKAVKTVNATRVVDKDGNVTYVAPEGSILVSKEDDKYQTISTSQKFDNKEQAIEFLSKYGLKFEDVTMLEYKVKTFEEIPNLYESRDANKKLTLK